MVAIAFDRACAAWRHYMELARAVVAYQTAVADVLEADGTWTTAPLAPGEDAIGRATREGRIAGERQRAIWRAAEAMAGPASALADSLDDAGIQTRSFDRLAVLAIKPRKPEELEAALTDVYAELRPVLRALSRAINGDATGPSDAGAASASVERLPDIPKSAHGLGFAAVGHSAPRMAQAIGLAALGCTAEKIASTLGVARSTVYRWPDVMLVIGTYRAGQRGSVRRGHRTRDAEGRIDGGVDAVSD